MIRANDVDQIELVKALAEQLKKEKTMTPPAWANFVKTSPAKDRVPSQEKTSSKRTRTSIACTTRG